MADDDGPMVGGWGPTQKATKETQKICDQVRSQVEKIPGKNYLVYVAVQFGKQVVAGANFVIKVHVGGDSYDHLSLFQALPCNGGQAELHGVEQNKTKDDPLVPFPK